MLATKDTNVVDRLAFIVQCFSTYPYKPHQYRNRTKEMLLYFKLKALMIHRHRNDVTKLSQGPLLSCLLKLEFPTT